MTGPRAENYCLVILAESFHSAVPAIWPEDRTGQGGDKE
ncbi:MAG: hypothetical protein RIR62_2660 [Pseudomonadota bacterium]